MESPTGSGSPELARVVWGAHILSYLHPHTTDRLDHHPKATTNPGGYCEEDSDEEDEFEEDIEVGTATQNTNLLTPYDTKIREKFLNCIAELLSHSKGGAIVTATALRENEDNVEVDLARNEGFAARDADYLSLLANFLAAEDTEDENLNEHFHCFLEKTIAYNANRIDFWIAKINRLMNRSTLRLYESETTPTKPDRACLLDCCTAPQRSMSDVVESLVLKIIRWDTSGLDACPERRNIVALSSIAMSSFETTQMRLQSLLPSTEPSKFLFLLRLLARPVTILRTLSTITRLFPNFHTVEFIPLKVAPPIKLSTKQVPRIVKAWKSLGLPSESNGSIPVALTQKARKFREDCTRALTIHCEIQLLVHYETNPWLTPTLAYFGCSKKACFLCSSYLVLSRLKPRVRGKHGVCHPNWAVPLKYTDSPMIRDILIGLCGTIKEQIILLSQPGDDESPSIVHQSTAVSELRSSDLVFVKELTSNREAVEKLAKEQRERMQTLLDPRSVGPRRIFCSDIRTICAMCQWPISKRCNRCSAIWYCSKRCQTIDWPAHKLLCRRFRPFLETRPSEQCRLGIWFRRDKDRPRLVWVPFLHAERMMYRPYFDHFLGPQHMLLWTLPFSTNTRRGIDLGYQITIYYPDYDETINKSVHQAVTACDGMTVPTTMHGNYVAVSGPPHGSATEHSDMALIDFRHTLDFFSTYFDNTIRETPGAATVVALKISSPLECILYGRETFSSVWVQRGFVSTSDVSQLAALLLSYEIRVCQVKEAEIEHQTGIEAEGSDWDNPFASVLMRDIDPSGESWGKVGNWKTKGSAILLREDGQDLDTKLAETMCRYCVNVLQPLFEKFVNGTVSQSEVLAEISQEKMSAWNRDKGNGR